MKHAWLVAALLLLAACNDTRGGVDGGASVGVDGSTASDGGGEGTDGATPPGGGGIGDPCTSDADCTDPPDAECFTSFENPFTGATVVSFPNGFCSKGCEESAECGGGDDVGCATLSMSGGGGGSSLQYCTIACDGPADCRADEGYQCQMIFGFGFCAPP